MFSNVDLPPEPNPKEWAASMMNRSEYQRRRYVGTRKEKADSLTELPPRPAELLITIVYAHKCLL
jgi:hypothetical protein